MLHQTSHTSRSDRMQYRELLDIVSLSLGGAALVLFSIEVSNEFINYNIVFYGLLAVIFLAFVNLVINQISLSEYKNISISTYIISIIAVTTSIIYSINIIPLFYYYILLIVVLICISLALRIQYLINE